jgi:K+-transporting ATPase KdpF subunit
MEPKNHERFIFHPGCDFVFSDHLWSASNLPSLDGGMIMLWIAGVLALGLLIYLFLALLWPERFG